MYPCFNTINCFPITASYFYALLATYIHGNVSLASMQHCSQYIKVSILTVLIYQHPYVIITKKRKILTTMLCILTENSNLNKNFFAYQKFKNYGEIHLHSCMQGKCFMLHNKNEGVQVK